MMTSRPVEGRMTRDPSGAEQPETRILAVFTAVLATGVLIAAWKIVRHFVG